MLGSLCRAGNSHFPLVTAVLLALVPASSVGQEAHQTSYGGTLPRFVHEVWTVRDGLPVNSITSLLQSRDGYIWAATFDGLVRFDGVRFTVYSTGSSDELPSNRIVELVEAGDGSLWLRTEQNHLVRFRDYVFTHFDASHGLADNTTRTVYEDPDGTIWVGTDSGLGFIQDDLFVPVAQEKLQASVNVVHRRADGSLAVGTAGQGVYLLTDLPDMPSVSREPVGGTIMSLYEDPDGTLWVGTAASLFRLRDGASERIAGPDGASVWRIVASPITGTIWVYSGWGIHRVEDSVATLAIDHRQATIRPWLMQPGPDGAIWFASNTEVFREGRPVYSLGNPGPNDPAPVTEIRAFLHDHEGSVWVGTNAAGLHRLKPSPFTVYSEAEGIAFRNVYPVYQDRSGAIWLGTWGRGVSRLAGQRITNFPRNPDPGLPNFILSLFQDRAGVLWVGGFNAGVRRCAVPELSCSRPTPDSTGYSNVYAIQQDRAGLLWFGTDEGLLRLGPEGWERFGPRSGAPTAPVRVFRQVRDGSLWMGTNGAGLARYEAGRFTPVGEADGLPSDLIRSLYQDSDGWLWIGTEGHGLARIDPSEWGGPGESETPPEITVYRARHGLFDEVIHQILEDDSGRLWMSTNRGIFWVRRAELNAFATGEIPRIHSTSYTERDGLRNREANGGFQPAGVKTSDGRLWFPTQDGVAVVDPAELERNMVPPPVVIERVILEDRVILPVAEPITLDAGERDLQIDYTALSFMAPENVRFRYQLQDFNSEWVEAGNRRSAFYTNLPPGDYTFRVVATNNEGVWNEEGAAIGISVAPHFYETRAYYIALAAALGVFAFLGVRWRVRDLRKRERELSRLVEARTEQLRQHEARLQSQNATLEEQAEKLKQLDRAKSRFFANVSHEFRTPLTLTIGPLEDLRGGLYGDLGSEPGRQLDMALRNARRLLRLVNQILDASKLESGELRLQARQQDLVAFIKHLSGAFAPLADRKRITFQMETPSEEVLVWFDSSALEKVFANLLSNAFKFTPEGGAITLKVEGNPTAPDQGQALVRVEDTGPGIAPRDLEHVFERFYQVSESQRRAQAGTGIGLSLAKEYVELHGGSISVESEMGEGTAFVVTLPLGREHLRVDQIAAGAPQQAQDTDTAAGPIDAESPAVGSEAAVAALEAEAADVSKLAVDGSAARTASDGPVPELRGAKPKSAGEPDDVTTVLVVDDNPDIRSYIRSHLESIYRVEEAGDGGEGIERVRTLLPDLVISDVMMPGVDGYELCRKLKADPETDFVPIILLTAKASTEHKVAGLDQGADDYLIKPFEMEELEARIANLIASRRRLRERFSGRPLELHSAAVDVTSADAKYLERVRIAIEGHISDDGFGVAELADHVGQDRSHLYRRIRALLDETPTELIRRLRLERAAQLLTGRAGSVAEVAYAVGFKGVSYFCKCFREAYGVTPSTYRDDASARNAGAPSLSSGTDPDHGDGLRP